MTARKSLVSCLLFFCLGWYSGLAQDVDNPGLLNILHIEPSIALSVNGEAPDLTLYEDEIRGWLDEAILAADFGSARWGAFRSDSMAFLDIKVELQPRPGASYLATVFTRVMRPGVVLDLPVEHTTIYDVPVMESAFAFYGSEVYFRRELQNLIPQFVGYAANRIAGHNPK